MLDLIVLPRLLSNNYEANSTFRISCPITCSVADWGPFSDHTRARSHFWKAIPTQQVPRVESSFSNTPGTRYGVEARACIRQEHYQPKAGLIVLNCKDYVQEGKYFALEARHAPIACVTLK